MRSERSWVRWCAGRVDNVLPELRRRKIYVRGTLRVTVLRSADGGWLTYTYVLHDVIRLIRSMLYVLRQQAIANAGAIDTLCQRPHLRP